MAVIPAGGLPFTKTMFIRWMPDDIATNDGLAIDDFTITYAPSADFDLDQDVDGNDYLAIQRNLGIVSGGSISKGDANKDGAVDLIDFFILRQQLGTTRDAPPQAAPNATPVPEPAAAAILLALVAFGASACRRLHPI